MLNWILTFTASLMLLVGFISMVTPIPGGTITIAAGLTLLIYSNAKARHCIQWIRSRIIWFNKIFLWLENTVGKRICIVGDTLGKTRPLEHAIDKALSHRAYMKEKLEETNS